MSGQSKMSIHKLRRAICSFKRNRRIRYPIQSLTIQRQSISKVTYWHRETGKRRSWLWIPRDRIHCSSKVIQGIDNSKSRNEEKNFFAKYETLTPNVVPRSSQKLAQDDEFSLYGVTLFKRDTQEFAHRCRELKYWLTISLTDTQMDTKRVQVQWLCAHWRNWGSQPRWPSWREIMGISIPSLC